MLLMVLSMLRPGGKQTARAEALLVKLLVEAKVVHRRSQLASMTMRC